MRILAWASAAMAVVVVATAIAGYVAIRAQLGHITHVKVIDNKNRPPRYTNALNFLLLGSDTRVGQRVGGRSGCNCSDTIMLVHISPGRGRVTVLSIPRDTMVPYYACSPTDGLPGQQADPYALERINATLAAGGPECVRETVEQQTGVYINNFIELNFTGFEQVINDVGGVTVCLPFPIDNVITASGGSGLHLPAGRSHINGKVALEFWRTRENVADGSDLARIARDQYLMAQIVKGVLHSGILGSPTKLYRVIGDIARAMTTDASDGELLSIASSLHSISTSNIQFVTAPWVPYPPDPNELEFAQPQANALFWALAHDAKLPKIAKPPAGKSHATPSPSPSQAETVSASKVKVTVLDGTTGTDLASQAAAALTSRGFTVLGTGYAPSATYTKTVVEYGTAADLPAARTLRQQFTSARIERVPGITPGTVSVILGSTFSKLAPPRQTSPTAIGQISTDYGGITASASCRNSAFYGTYDSAPAGNASVCAC